MRYPKIFLLIFLSIFPVFSFAQVYINEIMYDPADADSSREWVEIYNGGSDSVDIATWKFLENSTVSNHGLTQIQGTSSVPASGFAVIVIDSEKFLTDWPSFSGNLFRASFSSLNNTGANIILKDGELVVQDQVSYNSDQGAKGDGNSLQKTSTGWVSASPTPGLTNALVSSLATTTTTATTTPDISSDTQTTESQSQSYSNASAHSSPAPLSNTENKIEFEISAGRDRLTTVGNNLIFRATPTRLQNMSESGIVYRWSFGDGTVAQGSSVNHTYKFAGEYSVVVNANYSDKQAVSRVQVRVVLPNILIAKISDGVEISNNSKVEINLEGWLLVSSKKTFVFPADTLISGGKRITFADDVTGMSDETIQLLNPIGKELGSIKKTEKEEPKSVVTNLESVDLSEIQAKIEEVKNAVAQISGESQLSKSNSKTDAVSFVLVSEPIKTSLALTPVSDMGVNIEENVDHVANTATVFEATQQKGFVSTIFSWPIKGFNLIRRLFVEE